MAGAGLGIVVVRISGWMTISGSITVTGLTRSFCTTGGMIGAKCFGPVVERSAITTGASGGATILCTALNSSNAASSVCAARATRLATRRSRLPQASERISCISCAGKKAILSSITWPLRPLAAFMIAGYATHARNGPRVIALSQIAAPARGA